MKIYKILFSLSLILISSCTNNEKTNSQLKQRESLSSPQSFNFSAKQIGSPLSESYIPATPEQFNNIENANDNFKIKYGYSFG